MIGKLFVVGCLLLLLVSGASAYYCIYSEDNDSVKDFKIKLNNIAIKNDIEYNNLTEKAILLKLKYFGPCRWR